MFFSLSRNSRLCVITSAQKKSSMARFIQCRSANLESPPPKCRLPNLADPLLRQCPHAANGTDARSIEAGTGVVGLEVHVGAGCVIVVLEVVDDRAVGRARAGRRSIENPSAHDQVGPDVRTGVQGFVGGEGVPDGVFEVSASIISLSSGTSLDAILDAPTPPVFSAASPTEKCSGMPCAGPSGSRCGRTGLGSFDE